MKASTFRRHFNLLTPMEQITSIIYQASVGRILLQYELEGSQHLNS